VFDIVGAQSTAPLRYSADIESLRQLYSADERFAHFSAEARAVVSPLVELPGLWHEVVRGSRGVPPAVHRPRSPSAARSSRAW
jgi:hypothetical protein